MKILIAEDDSFFRRLLHRLLAAEYEVAMVADGVAAWDLLQRMEGPVLAILDWVMPGMMGPDICRAVRAESKTADAYLILLTARHSSEDILAGLRAGADDYVTKPFKPDELRARVHLGQRIVQLEESLIVQSAALESVRAREAFLQNRLAELESSIRAAALQPPASSFFPSPQDTIVTKSEFNTTKPAPALPVNNSKVS